MRVSEDRYIRDLQRIQLAHRMIRHEVRTATICAWTGFNEERIRNLAKSYRSSPAGRHRGPPPQKVEVLLRHSLLRAEAACLGGLAHAYRLLPTDRVVNAASVLPSVALGEKLCHVYEIYRRVVPQARLTTEHFILLVIELAGQSEVRLDRCGTCPAVVILERHSREHRLCFACRAGGPYGRTTAFDERPALEPPIASTGVQQPLF